MCDVFRNGGLPSSYDGQLRAMVIACFVLEAIGVLGQKTNATWSFSYVDPSFESL